MKWRNLILTGFLFTAGVTGARAQAIVRGTVQDSSSLDKLDQATISVYKDSTLIRKMRTRGGMFSMRLQPGEYFVTAAFVGYVDDTLHFSVRVSDTLLHLGIMRMERADNELAAVVVKTVAPPVITRNDTIVYNASSFKTRPGASVEDLLKKLPGVVVDKEGTVTVQGKKIEGIYIDGKEFMVGDPKLATQNLLADMVEKIESFDKKSDMGRATGIRDAESGGALNFRLKADRKSGMFGKMYAAAGSSQRYATGANINRLANAAMLQGSFNFNNTAGMFDPGPLRSVNGGQLAPAENRFLQSNISYNNSFSKQWQGSGMAGYDDIRNKGAQSSRRETFYSDSSLLQDKNSVQGSKTTTARANISLRYTPDSVSKVRLDISFSDSRGDNASFSGYATQVIKGSDSYLLNQSSSRQQVYSDTKNFNYSLTYGRRLNSKGRYFLITAGQTIGGNHSSTLLNTLFSSAARVGKLDQKTLQDGNNNRVSLRVNYAEPLGKGKFLDVDYSMNYSLNHSDRRAFLLDTATKKYDIVDTTATNILRNKSLVQGWSVGFNHTLTKLNYQVGIGWQQTSQDNIDETGRRKDIKQKFITIVPRVLINYSMSKTKSFQVSYSGRGRQPGIEQIQPVPDYSNPLLIRLGNTALKREFTHDLNANIILGKQGRYNNLFLNAGISTTANRIMSSTILLPQSGVQVQQFVNVNGNYQFNGSATYSAPLGDGKLMSFRSSSRVSFGRDISFLNGAENVRKSFAVSATGYLDLHFEEKLFADISATLSYGSNTYSASAMSGSRYLNQQYTVEISYELPDEILLATSFYYQRNGAQQNLPALSNALWNAALSKKIFARKTGELRLSVFDLLGSNTGITQSAGDSFVETGKSEVLQRFFLASFIYSFRWT